MEIYTPEPEKFTNQDHIVIEVEEEGVETIYVGKLSTINDHTLETTISKNAFATSWDIIEDENKINNWVERFEGSRYIMYLKAKKTGNIQISGT